MSNFSITADFEPAGDQAQAIESLVRGIVKGDTKQTLKGVTGSGKTFTMAKIIEATNIPTLVLSHNKTLAAQLYREFKTFFPNNVVEYFVSYYDYYQPEAYVPSRDLYIEKDASINDEIDRRRLAATSALMERDDVIIVATVSCIYGLGNPKAYIDMKITVQEGEPCDFSEITKQLVSLQYERNDSYLDRGKFRLRGDILEIFPAYQESAIRIETTWNEIDRIRRINPITGETIEELARTTIYPAKHFVLPEDQVKGALRVIQKEADNRYQELLDAGNLVAAERIKARTNYDLEMLSEVGYCGGIENYSRHLSGRKEGERPAVLLDYFPENFLTFIDESHVTLPQIGAMYRGDRSRKENLVNFGFRLPSALDNRPLKYEEFDEMVPQRVYVSATPGDRELEESSQIVEQIIRPTGLLDPAISVRPTEGQIEDLYGEIIARIKRKERVLITTLTKKMSEDLTDYLLGLDLKVRYLHSDIDTVERVEILQGLRSGDFDVLVGINLLREGLDLPEVSLVAILDADKIGFLRSTQSLIQTIGRAARNAAGEVIMYADVESSAMSVAIEETERRRAIQQAYNEEHGITPKTIKKAVQTIIERERDEKTEAESTEIEVIKAGYNLLIEKDRNKLIRRLEKEMFEAAKNMEFERAAVLRDEIFSIKKL